MDGNIDFISREGIGSTFFIELPELVGEVQLTEEKTIRQLPCEHRACVLIIEDDPDIAALIRRMLAESGYNSDIAYDAQQAREKLTTNSGQ